MSINFLPELPAASRAHGELKSPLIEEIAARHGLPIITITANVEENDIMGLPDTTPTMDQLWDRLPDDPDALEPEALQRWANRLSPKARAAILAALHNGCTECGRVLVVPEENKPYVCGTCITKRSDKNNG